MSGLDTPTRTRQRADDARVAELADQSIKGQLAADRALADLAKGHASPDLLHGHLQALQATGQPERVRGFLRVVQKRLERCR